MEYHQTIRLKNGALCCLRNGVQEDGAAALECFQQTHAETDYLLSYPDETSLDAEQEGMFLREKSEREREIELVAMVGQTVAGMAGIEAIGTSEKVQHRAEFGINVREAFWGLGIGQALTAACIQCAKEAGYLQLELSAVADNEAALALYRKAGFVEYGRNPQGFRSRHSGFQELVLMRLELK